MADTRRVARLRPTFPEFDRDGHLTPPRLELVHNLDDKTITAASMLVTELDRYRTLKREPREDEAWEFYQSLGEFNYGVEWFGEALSRVRLTAARVSPGGDEPEVIDEGLPAELVSALVGGVDGQSQMLRSFAIHLSVVGDSYLVGREVTDADIRAGVLMDAEPDANGWVWTVQPASTIRRPLGSREGWELRVDEIKWVLLPEDSLIIRVWDRNESAPWRAMSPAFAALPIMREIDMYNRQIMASLVSRVASNGLLFIPDEVILPASPQYENAADPFIAELLDIMTAAIKSPGSPASAMPVPLRVPADFIDKFKHLTFFTPLDGKVFESREQAIRRLAATLNLPAEIITGMGDVNHWSAWALSEDAIKIHISPKVELITRALTLGYLHPMLRAMDESVREADGSRIIVWYDTSELTQRPDRSGSAVSLREMLVISDEATRRETGFDEADAPSRAQLQDMILQKLAVDPRTAGPALKALTGLELDIPEPVAPQARSEDDEQPEDNEEERGMPDTRDAEPPEPDEPVEE